MTNAFMWLIVAWIPVLEYFLLKNEAKMKKNLMVGVTLPAEAAEDEQILRRLVQFKRAELWICLGMMLLALPGMLIEDFGAMMFIWGIWIILMVVIPYIPYALCNRDLKKIKKERGWQKQQTNEIIVDTAVIRQGYRVSPAWFIIPGILSLVPILWEHQFLLLYVVDAAMVICFWMSYRFLYRNKAERVDDNMELTQALTEMRRENWAKAWLIFAYMSACISFDVALFWQSPLILTAIIILITLVIAAAAMRIEFQTRDMQQKLTENCSGEAVVDEDDHWIWGIFYYNKQDSNWIVNNRVGINTTFNMAKPAGQIIMALSAAVILMIPFIVPMTEAVLNHPPVIEISETVLMASSGTTKYEIPLNEIKAISLEEKLPDRMVRVMGTGMEDLLVGKFTAKETGKLSVCLDPTCGPFLLIQTEKKKYLLGMRDTEDTRSIYQTLAEMS